MTVLNRWQTALTTAIASSCVFEAKADEVAPQEGSLKRLLSKKSLTMEEAQIVKEIMKQDEKFVHDGVVLSGEPAEEPTKGGEIE